MAFAVVMGVHALRRRTSLAHSYAVLTFMRLDSWAAAQTRPVAVGPLELSVGSNVFFSAILLGVFLLAQSGRGLFREPEQAVDQPHQLPLQAHSSLAHRRLHGRMEPFPHALRVDQTRSRNHRFTPPNA